MKRVLLQFPAAVISLLVMLAAAYAGDGEGNAAAQSTLLEPLPATNTYAPFSRFFDPLAQNALRPYSERLSVDIHQHYSSLFYYDTLPAGKLLVDMEVYTVETVLRRTFFEDVELALRLPLHYAWRGMLDGPIQNFHKLTGLPNGGRENRPNDRYGYDFNVGGGWSDGPGAEIGNAVLTLRTPLLSKPDEALAALAAVKLPTASASRGWGSGAADIGAGMVWSQMRGAWFGHLDGWLIYPLAADIAGVDYSLYFRGAAVLGWRWADNLSALVQIQGGSSPYSTSIARLKDGPLLITFGLRGELESGMGWSIAFAEDLSYYTTQDFSLVFGLSWR